MLAFYQPAGIVSLAPRRSSPHPASPIFLCTKRFLLTC
jgi:hypothetical protein